MTDTATDVSAVNEFISKTIAEHPVALFMKGTPPAAASRPWWCRSSITWVSSSSA